MARLVVILGLALIIFGPRDLPRLALTLWRTLEDLRRALEEFADSFRRELELLEREEATQPPNA
jgi:Sec-independent protein translocase protein TatA